MAYCTRADIESLYGATNVAKWADMDGDGDSVTIANRITQAINVASARIDDRFRGSLYSLPLSQTEANGLVQITDCAARFAGVWLYNSRGTHETDSAGNPFNRLSGHDDMAEKTIDRFISGKAKLAAAPRWIQPSVPVVIG
jgi:phage gp36-like protein